MKYIKFLLNILNKKEKIKLIKKNKLDIKIIKLKKNKKKSLIGSNKLAKKILKWEPKKSIFQAANEIYKLNKKN